MRADNLVYEKSNKIESVSLNSFSRKEVSILLTAGESISERQKLAQSLVNYLCDKFKISRATVSVVNRSQPHSIGERGTLKSKTLGTYLVSSELITMYNLTAVRKQSVSIKTFLDTLLHEFMHHYDITYLKLGGTLHTAGFYKRISDLSNKLK